MAWTRLTWIDDDGSLTVGTLYTAARMNNIEEGIEEQVKGDWKDAVRVCTTANVTISTALNNADVIDGISLVTGDRVLVANQTTKKENGIYIVGAVPARAADADAAGELSGGVAVHVEAGTIYGNRDMHVHPTTGSITPGTTEHEWAPKWPKDHGIVEALPTSAALKGDTCTYKTASAGVFWSLIYDAEGEFPWKKIGGPPLYNEVTTQEATKTTSYTGLTTAGPSITLPLKGDYDITIGAQMFNNTANNHARMSYKIGAAAALAENEIDKNEPTAGAFSLAHGSRTRRKTGFAAATVLLAQYMCTPGGEASFVGRFMVADPIRVG